MAKGLLFGPETHLDIHVLHARGWTEGLIRRYLGEADMFLPVNHWANHTGKRVWHVGRVLQAEGSRPFKDAYARSLRRREATELEIARFARARRDGPKPQTLIRL